MNQPIWSNTRSNLHGYHAFPETNAACSSRIKPNDTGATFLTAEQVKQEPLAHPCERCVKKVAALDATAEGREAGTTETQGSAMRVVTAEEAQAFANERGEIVYGGKVNDMGPHAPVVSIIEVGARGAIKIRYVRNRKTEKLRAGSTFYAAPSNAQESGETAQERKAQATEAENARHEKAERKARTRKAQDREERRAVESADRYIEREAPKVAALLREGEAASPAGVPAAQVDRNREIEEAAADRAEREAYDRAKGQAERLRNRKALTKSVPVVNAPVNFRDLAKSANTEAARRYWQRRCDEIEMVETVKAHAQANYDLGWDTVVETYGDAEILEYLRSEHVNATTPESAIKAFDDLADDWAADQCRALVDGYGV